MLVTRGVPIASGGVAQLSCIELRAGVVLCGDALDGIPPWRSRKLSRRLIDGRSLTSDVDVDDIQIPVKIVSSNVGRTVEML